MDCGEINYNGALIWDEPNQKPIFHRPMSHELVAAMIDRSRDMFEEVLVTCEILDSLVRRKPRRSDRHHRNRQAFQTRRRRPRRADSAPSPSPKLMLLGDQMKSSSRLESLLLEEFGDKAAPSFTPDDEPLQIMDNRVSKAVALQKIAAHYGVKQEEVMAIGDAPNDVGMLQFAGVASGDSPTPTTQSSKKSPTGSRPSNDEHGVHAAACSDMGCANSIPAVGAGALSSGTSVPLSSTPNSFSPPMSQKIPPLYSNYFFPFCVSFAYVRLSSDTGTD